MEWTPEERALVRSARALQSLIATPEWKVYEEFLRNEVDIAASRALRPAAAVSQDGLLAALDSEFNKGVFKGLQLALTHPSSSILAMEEFLKTEDPDNAE